MTDLTINDFRPYEGRSLRLKDFDFALTLSKVEGEDGPPPPGFARAPFLIILSGPKQPLVRPGIYVCEIEDGPTYELHISPIHTADNSRQDYQSAFN
jgi:uncharacterized protein DUF6916